MTKMEMLAQSEGFDKSLDLIEDRLTDSVVPGICMNQGCGYTTEVEPDQDSGWCEICETRSVKSCMLLEGMI